ncbi:Predicted acyltransferase [Sphingomonas gellani]|uniref:Predicted acyltransferase n=1 Tax=Sphingomonas gellani TaxID=1166340 RepID=A0A1H8AZ12_9SPHN|nr:heparan-alpha-glucosaminide N-acetyltransferase domain-containing protein [Sphingomonas gellani]SEM75154.1 Predicted acyltransferase [Sphingomonas gellani]
MREEQVENRAPGRMQSLDILRGIAVMGMILANASAGMFYDNKAQVYATLLHVHWNGLHLADTVFPGFLMMVGVAIPMSLDRDKRGVGQGDVGIRIARRCFRLFLIGFLLSNLHWLAHSATADWRFWGVLQRIGIVYGVCALLFLKSGPRTWITVATLLLAGYWPLLMVPQPDGQPTDLWVRGLNFAGWVDRAMLGAGKHIYVPGAQGYDPEGLLGMLPAIAQGLIGVVIGEYMRRQRGSDSVSGGARTLMLAGAIMLVVGLVWSLVFPMVKDLWSSPFVLVTSGLTTLVLGVLHATIDRRSKPVGWPATIALAFGSNAIAAYILHELTAITLTWDALLLPYRWAMTWMSPQAAALVPVLLYMALIGAAMTWLRRRNWIIKV